MCQVPHGVSWRDGALDLVAAVRAEVCVAVEDSAVGVASALAAGCAVIAVGEQVTAPDLPRILRVGALTDVTMEAVALLTKLNQWIGRRPLG